MSNINAILNQRMKTSSNGSKMASMARQSAAGHLTSFSGMFSVIDLSFREKEALVSILKNHQNAHQSIEEDLEKLISLTSEVKAINHQAALLHGERVKKAQVLLKNYKEGAFTAWMIAAYGNRQTPYNLMQYFEFCELMPKNLRPRIEEMPRQAIYTLATRKGEIERKKAIVENYQGETKQQLLLLIRRAFPLEKEDRRKTYPSSLCQELAQLYEKTKKHLNELKEEEKKEVQTFLKKFQQLLK